MTECEKYLVHIKATGEVNRINQSTRPNLAQLKALVGGYIEYIGGIKYDGHNCYMWCNEEGKFKRLPINERATKLFKEAHRSTDIIVGDVVVVIGWED